MILSNPGITLTDCEGNIYPSAEIVKVPVSGIFIAALKLPALTSAIYSSVTSSLPIKILTKFIESGNSDPEILNSIFSRTILGISITCALNCVDNKKRKRGKKK